MIMVIYVAWNAPTDEAAFFHRNETEPLPPPNLRVQDRWVQRTIEKSYLIMCCKAMVSSMFLT